MPKIIKDGKEKILKTAHELFATKSYEEVDMRKIAKECGIAVGTLYNYYPNKYELFKSVITDSWNNTFTKLNTLIEDSISPDEKIHAYFELFFKELNTRNGMGKQLVKLELIADNTQTIEVKAFTKIINKIEFQFFSLLEEVYPNKIKQKKSIDLFIKSIFTIIIKLDLEKDCETKTSFILELIEGYMNV